MKAERLDHIHIYVKDIEKAKKTFSKALGTTFSPVILPKDLPIKSVMSPIGLELIEPIDSNNAVGKALERGGEGIYGLSFKVPDIEEGIKALQAQGMRLVGRVNEGRIKEAQFHPRDAHGVMIELCEYEDVSLGGLAALGKGF